MGTVGYDELIIRLEYNWLVGYINTFYTNFNSLKFLKYIEDESNT